MPCSSTSVIRGVPWYDVECMCCLWYFCIASKAWHRMHFVPIRITLYSQNQLTQTIPKGECL